MLKARNTSPVYPIVTTTIISVPPELLQVIFWLGTQGCTSEQSTQFVLRVTHVCKTWRTAALQHSILFTSIDMMWEPARRSEWLARTGVQYLNLYLHQSHIIPERWDWSELAAESFRWRSVDIHMADEPRLIEAIGMIMALDNLSNLESLAIGDGNDPPARFDLLQRIPNLPALRSLVVEYFQLDHIERIGHSLTDLRITGMEYTASEWISIFQACKNLESLEIYGNAIKDHPQVSVALLNLHTLRISWTEESTLRFIFRSLQCPNLDSLFIEMALSPRDRDFYIRPMMTFLQTVTRLRHLTIVDDCDPDEDQCSLYILDMLTTPLAIGQPTLLPALDHLEICCDGPYLRTFLGLSEFPSSGRPVLKILGLNRCSTEDERQWLAARVGTLIIDPEQVCARPQWTLIV